MAVPASTLTSEHVISTASSEPSRWSPTAANGRLPAAALAAQPAKDPQEAAAGFLRKQDRMLHAQQFLTGITEQPFRGRIHEGDGPVRGQQQKRVRTLLQQVFTKSSSHDDTGPQSDGSSFQR